jgi:hypothetical protein
VTDKWILEGHDPRPAELLEWAEWFGKADRVVDKTHSGDVEVSTVFLGLDHQFGEGPPLIFETMIFGGEHDQYTDRCSTWDEAVEMHRRACKLALPVN